MAIYENTNLQEDYVSFETAKLLKEKGFDGEYRAFWKDWKGEIRLCSCNRAHMFDYCSNSMLRIYNGSNELNIAAPTLQMAMKWLRKVHEIFIRPNISFLYPIRYYCEIFCYGDNLKTQQDVTTENFESPEEACEAAIKYCLENLI